MAATATATPTPTTFILLLSRLFFCFTWLAVFSKVLLCVEKHTHTHTRSARPRGTRYLVSNCWLTGDLRYDSTPLKEKAAPKTVIQRRNALYNTGFKLNLTSLVPTKLAVWGQMSKTKQKQASNESRRMLVNFKARELRSSTFNSDGFCSHPRLQWNPF